MHGGLHRFAVAHGHRGRPGQPAIAHRGLEHRPGAGAGFARHPPRGREVGDAEPTSACQGIAGPHEDREFVDAPEHGIQFGALGRPFDEPDVERTGDQPVLDLRAVADLEVDVHAVVGRGEARDPFRQQVHADGRTRADPQAPSHFPIAAKAPHQVGGALQQVGGLLQQARAARVADDAPPAAVEQRATELLAQFRECRTDGRLREVELFGRRGDVLRPGDGEEDLELAQGDHRSSR